MLSTLIAGVALANPTNTEITVYNQGFGLVKETRVFNLTEGRQNVSLKNVPSLIEPTSVGFKNLTATSAFSILEQNYQYDLISPEAILNKSVGQRIRFIRTMGQQKEQLEGILLSAPVAIINAGNGGQPTYNGMVIRTDDGRIVLDPTGEIEVIKMPEGLISVPTLVWDIESERAGDRTVELSYITQGLSWNADYVLTLDGTGKSDLQGWVTLNNSCGTTFTNAKLKLLAGDVQRAQNRGEVESLALADGVRFKAARAPAFQEESLFEYHLYTLQRPATLKNKETKQISFLEGHQVPVTKKLILDAMLGFNNFYPGEGQVGTGDLKPQVRLEFTNDKASGLGMPLPKGKIKVYQRDSEGSVQLLGEDQIDHTPRDERLSLVMGRSFDVVGNRVRTNFSRIGSSSVSESFTIEVRNRKETPETVHVYERHWGDWRITKKNQDFIKLDANTADFVVMLKAGEVKSVTYTVETRW